jgi:hypothetical protein
MNSKSTSRRRLARLSTTAAAMAFLALSAAASAEQVRVELSGAAEVPPVETKASGSGVINIGVDNSITGIVHTSGVNATMAHIHDGAAGKSGPVIIPLIREGSDGWTVPPNTKLTEEQVKAFKAGDLYVNVHSSAHPAGEIRGQLKP